MLIMFGICMVVVGMSMAFAVGDGMDDDDSVMEEFEVDVANSPEGTNECKEALKEQKRVCKDAALAVKDTCTQTADTQSQACTGKDKSECKRQVEEERQVCFKNAEADKKACVVRSKEERKLCKEPSPFTTFIVLSEEATAQVVVDQPATILKQIQASQASGTILVGLPVDAIDVHVFSVSEGIETNIDASVTVTYNATDAQVRVDNIPTVDLNIYYTIPGPTQEEVIQFVIDSKQVTVSSGFHFTNVLARTNIHPLPPELVKLEHVVDGVRTSVQDITLIDADGDGFIEEITWIVPHLSTEIYLIGLNTAFETARADDPTLPTGWYVQTDGSSNQDDGCLDLGSWILTNQTYSGVNGAMYLTYLDIYGCGLKLPSFQPNVEGVMNMTFNFWSNFTSPSDERDSAMEIINYGNDNECHLVFNATTIIEQETCTATITNLGSGWNLVTVTDWVIYSPTEVIALFITPPFILNQLGEEGVMIFDDMKVTLPS